MFKIQFVRSIFSSFNALSLIRTHAKRSALILEPSQIHHPNSFSDRMHFHHHKIRLHSESISGGSTKTLARLGKHDAALVFAKVFICFGSDPVGRPEAVQKHLQIPAAMDPSLC